MARSARMIGIGGAIPTSSRRFSFPDRSEKGLLDYGIAWPIWGAPADRPTGRFPRPDRRGESYEPYPDPGQPPSRQRMRLTAPPGAGMAVSLRNRVRSPAQSRSHRTLPSGRQWVATGILGSFAPIFLVCPSHSVTV